jgi:hypothetical protein
MKPALALAISAAVLGLSIAAPVLAENQECASLSDAGLLARALAEEKVEKRRAHAILRRIYEIPDDRSRRLARLVVESAYRDSSPASEFALKLEAVCKVSQGDVASMLDGVVDTTPRAAPRSAPRSRMM